MNERERQRGAHTYIIMTNSTRPPIVTIQGAHSPVIMHTGWVLMLVFRAIANDKVPTVLISE